MPLLHSFEVSNSTNIEYLCESLNLSHEILVNILGGHGIGINIHCCQPISNRPRNEHLCTKISFLTTAIKNHCTLFNYELTLAKTK